MHELAVMYGSIQQALLFLTIVPFAHFQNDYNEYAWEVAAKYLRQAMNEKSPPCDNFYEHVCGNYGISQEAGFEISLESKASAVAAVLGDAIENICLESDSTPRYQKAIKVFFDKCTAAIIDENWPRALYQALEKRIGGLPLFDNFTGNGTCGTYDLWFLMGKVQRELGEVALIKAEVDYVETDCGWIPELQVMLPIPAAARLELNRTAARHHTSTIAQMLGLDTVLLDAHLDSWLDKVSAFDNDWRNVTSIDDDGQRFKLWELDQVMPEFDWRAYFSGLLPENVRQHLQADLDAQIYIDNVDLLKAIADMLGRHEAGTIKFWVFLRMFYSIQDLYFGDPEEPQLIFHIKSPNDRCLEFALEYLSPAMALLYFDTIGLDITQWRHEIQLLGRNIFSAFRLLLNSVDWVDTEDKEKLQKKVDNIAFNPGIPSWIRDEDEVLSRIAVYDSNLDPFENQLIAAQTAFDRWFIHLENDTHSADPDEPNPSFEINAYYDPDSQQISLLLGMMLPPLFNVTYPLPVKYGGLGAIIGHELMHAFDADGVLEGVLDDSEWLKDETLRQFDQRKDCLIDQYDSFCFNDTEMCVNGTRTLSENIGDIDGIKVAYTAYKVVTQVMGVDPPVPGMIHYTHDQLFFLAYARGECSRGDPNWMDLVDEHAPSKARVEVALRNVDLFGKAFGCPVGSRYVPLTSRCSLWGEMKAPAMRR